VTKKYQNDKIDTPAGDAFVVPATRSSCRSG
jgi:hypothetical protein